MRKAKVQIITAAATCPYCENDEVYDPQSGSLYIDVNQYSPSDTFECLECGAKFQLEAKAWK